jgi:hypothetical protein
MPQFDFQPGVLTQPVTIDIDGSGPSVTDLVENTPPGGDPIVFAKADINLSGGTSFNLPNGQSGVTFHAEADALIGIYPSTDAVTAAVSDGFDLVDQLSPALDFPPAGDTHFALLRWNYDLGASGSGAVAFGAGPTITTTLGVGRGGFYAVVKQIPDGPGCDDIVRGLVKSVILPKSISDLESIPPGTWVISEAEGSLTWSIDATYGHDFTWMRKFSAGQLTGDIGLKLQLGLEATLNFTASGRHAVVVSRGSGDLASRLRLRLYRLSSRDFTAGFSAGAVAQGAQTGIPASFPDLIAGIVGTSGLQTFNALQKLDMWTNPGQPLLGPFVEVGREYAAKFLKATTGFDVNTAADQVRDLLQNLFEKWNDLPQVTTALIWSRLPDQQAIAEIARLADQIASLDSPKLVGFLVDKLQFVPFFRTPQGQWLESLVPDGVFSALLAERPIADIQRFAGLTRDLLSGAELTNVLTKLQAEIATRLNLQQIEDVVNTGTLADLDPWLAGRLENFLAQKAPLVLDQIRALRDQIRKLKELTQSWYTKGLDALTHQYTASLNATYESATTRTALLDLVFNFAPATAADAKACLAMALSGQLQDLFTNPNHPGIVLNQGLLTHAIKRQTQIELHLPYFDQTQTHIQDILARLSAVDQQEGRLLTATATAQDTVALARNRNNRDSALMTVITLRDLVAKSGVVIHEPPAVSCSYTLTDVSDSLKVSTFDHRYAAVLQDYFRQQFPEEQHVENWIARTLPKSDLGKTTVSLSVVMPAEAVLAWKNAPANPKSDVYRTLARALIGKYRSLLMQQYFLDESRYGLTGVQSPTFTLLVYASVPIAQTAILDQATGEIKLDSVESGRLCWDFVDPDLRNAMLGSSATVGSLKRKLAGVRERLAEIGSPLVGSYTDDNIPAMIRAAQKNVAVDLLFRTESEIVENARSAGIAIAKAVAGGASAPDVLDNVAAFGKNLGEAFNSGLRNWISGSLLLPLGSILLAEASQVLSGDAAPAEPNAMFTLEADNARPARRFIRIARPAALVARG